MVSGRIGKISCFGLGLVMSAGCSDPLDTPHEALIVAATPTARAVAASTHFMGCKGRASAMNCYACDVTAHNTPEGLVVYATHWEHALQPRDGEMRISVSGEIANKKYQTDGTETALRLMQFQQGEAWCRARGSGHYHALKNEL